MTITLHTGEHAVTRTPLKAAIARAKEAHRFMLTHAMRNQYLHWETHSGHWAYDDYPTGIRVCLNANGGYSHKERAYGTA